MFEEHKYEELKKLGTELHIPIFEAFLKLEVFDKDGNLVQEHSQRSHSWVRNAYNVMFCQLAGKDADDSTFEAGKLSVKDTIASIKYGDFAPAMGAVVATNQWKTVDGLDYGYRATGAEDSWGIQVGSGTTAESFEDYVLDTQLTEGTGAGNISYVASQAHAITYTAGTKVLKNDLIRYFNNNTGGSRAVNEVALVGKFQAGTTNNRAYNFLMARDKLGATVTVADTGQLKVTYTIQITYPS